jgi:SAM-dependent methyltransferase
MTHHNSTAKYEAEMAFWLGKFEAEGGRFTNTHYRRLMLGMAQRHDDSFLRGKIVADFGCGPRGSLCWARPARLRIGIDVLADQYARFNIREQDMCYVNSSESWIPLPTRYVDVMFTLNAIDHVDNFEQMCCEILRVIVPGGAFYGSFNLEEPATVCEPQTLTEEKVRRALVDRLEEVAIRTAPLVDPSDRYKGFFDGSVAPTTGRRFMWVSGRKTQGSDLATAPARDMTEPAAAGDGKR